MIFLHFEEYKEVVFVEKISAGFRYFFFGSGYSRNDHKNYKLLWSGEMCQEL